MPNFGSWNKVINSEKCSQTALSCVELAKILLIIISVCSVYLIVSFSILLSCLNNYYAKKLLYSNCFPDEPIPRRSGPSAKNSSLSDIIATLSRCSAKNIDIPEFVIKSPSVVPSIPASAYSILTAKVNQWLAHVNSPATSKNSSLVSDGRATNRKPSYAILLKYPPPELRDPVSHKEKLDSFAGHDGNFSVKSDPVRKRWLVATRDKVSTNSLAASAFVQTFLLK